MTASIQRERTTEERFNAALEAVARAGVHVRISMYSRCRSCVTYTLLALKEGEGDTRPYLGNIVGPQGHEFEWHEGEPVHVKRDDRECECWYEDGALECDLCRHGPRPPKFFPAKDANCCHCGPDETLAATVFAEAMRAEGFTVDWDGDPTKDIVVTF